VLVVGALALCPGCLTLGYRAASVDFEGARGSVAFGLHQSGVFLDTDSAVAIDLGIEWSRAEGTTEAWGEATVGTRDRYIGVMVPWLNEDIAVGSFERLLGCFGFGVASLKTKVELSTGASDSQRAPGFYLSWGVYWFGRRYAGQGLGIEVRHTWAAERTILSHDVDAGGLSVTALLAFQ
jgi:hypothetical protein